MLKLIGIMIKPKVIKGSSHFAFFGIGDFFNRRLARTRYKLVTAAGTTLESISNSSLLTYIKMAARP
jgi:hypothetical protein